MVDGNLIVPATVTSIGDYAFYGCSALASVTFEADSALETIGVHAFRGSGLTTIAIPASVKSIATRAFYECSVLASVTYACSATPLSIESSVFSSTPYLTNGRVVPDPACRVIEFDPSCDDVVGGNLLVANTVTSIPDKAFESCGALKTITFEAGSTLETIGYQAFDGSSGQTKC